MKYVITWEENGYLAEFEGKLNIEDFAQLIEETHGHELFSDIEYVIYDYRNADLSNIKNDDLDPIFIPYTIGASFTLTEVKIALVATEAYPVKLHEYVMEKLKEFGIMWELEVFPNLEEARKWIKLI